MANNEGDGIGGAVSDRMGDIYPAGIDGINNIIGLLYSGLMVHKRSDEPMTW